jgi:hypothetical protein
MTDVKVIVRHRDPFGDWYQTSKKYEIPENISPENVADFSAAMVEHTAAIHQGEFFSHPERSLVEAVRRQILTSLLNDALYGPGKRLAERALDVLALDDTALLASYAHARKGGPNVG